MIIVSQIVLGLDETLQNSADVQTFSQNMRLYENTYL